MTKMLGNQRPKVWLRQGKGVAHLLLVLAIVFLLGHESQHDLPSAVDIDGTQCEFCLNGHGPIGITSAEVTVYAQVSDFFFRNLPKNHSPASFRGFSYSSRAPPRI